MAGRSTATGGPCPNPRQRHRARGNHQGVWRGTHPSVDRLGRVHRRRAHLADHPDPACPRPTASCATPSAICSATCTISIPTPTRCPATAAGDRPVDPGPRRRSGLALPRLVRRVRVPQGLSRGLRFRHRRPQLHLLRCAEGPPLHLGHESLARPQCPNRAVPPGASPGSPARPHPDLHLRRSLAASREKRAASTRLISSRSPPNFPTASPPTPGSGSDNWNSADRPSRPAFRKRSRPPSRERSSAPPLEASVQPLDFRRTLSVPQPIRQRTAGPVHRFSSRVVQGDETGSISTCESGADVDIDLLRPRR